MGSMFCKTICVQWKNTVCKKTASWHLLFAIVILHGVGQDKERHGEALFTQLIHKSHTLKIVGRREKGGVQMSEFEWRVFMWGVKGGTQHVCMETTQQGLRYCLHTGHAHSGGTLYQVPMGQTRYA